MIPSGHGARANGFSLIEVVVASALLTTGLLAAVQLFIRATATNASARTQTQATLLAVEKMEQLRARSIDDAALQQSPPEALTTDVEGYFDRPAESFVRRWSVEALPSYPDDGVVVRVVVRRSGTAGSALLETVKVRKPTGAPPATPD